MGGAERLTQGLMNGFDRMRIEPISINLYDPGVIGEQLLASGHTVISNLAKGKFDVQAGSKLRRVVAEQKVDVVYVADSALPLFWTGWLRRNNKTPKVVLGFHSTGKISDHFQHSVANKCAFPVVDRFIALAPTHLEYLTKAHKLRASRFSVIPSGVDTNRFCPAVDKAQKKAALGIAPDAPVAGIVAALRPEKNHELFLKAARMVTKVEPNSVFLIVGAGEEKEKIEDRINFYRLQDNVKMLGARNDVPEIFQAMDTAVLSSHPVVETFPVTQLEAMACGIPVVSTNVGSVKDVVEDGITGFLSEPGDAGALADNIMRVFADKEAASKMGHTARVRAENCFTVEQMVRAYEDMFLMTAEDRTK